MYVEWKNCVILSTLSLSSNQSIVNNNFHKFEDWYRICIAIEKIDFPELCDEALTYLNYGWSSALNVSAPLLSDCNVSFILLDDVKLPDTFSPYEMLGKMETFELDVASPRIHKASHYFMDTQGLLYEKEEAKRPCILKTKMIEFFATMFTGPAWSCFLKLISADIGTLTDGIGWGYDVCLSSVCPQLYMGVIQTMHAEHLLSSRKWKYQGRQLSLRSIPLPVRKKQMIDLSKWVYNNYNSRCHNSTWKSTPKHLMCI